MFVTETYRESIANCKLMKWSCIFIHWTKIDLLELYLNRFRIKWTKLNSQDLCYLNHTELKNSWRNMSARSAKLFDDHGSKEVKCFTTLDDPF